MEGSGEENEDEIILPAASPKPQKTLFSYFTVDKRSIAVACKTDATAEKKNSGSRNGISIALFGRNAAKKMGRTTPKCKNAKVRQDNNDRSNSLSGSEEAAGKEADMVHGCQGVNMSSGEERGVDDVDSNVEGESEPRSHLSETSHMERNDREGSRKVQVEVCDQNITDTDSGSSPQKKSDKSPVKSAKICEKSPGRSPKRSRNKNKAPVTSPLVTNSPIRRTSRRGQGRLCFDSSEDEEDKEQRRSAGLCNGVVSSAKKKIFKSDPVTAKIEECEDEDEARPLTVVNDEAPACPQTDISVGRFNDNVPMEEEKKPLLMDEESQTMISNNMVSSQDSKETETFQYVPHIGTIYPTSAAEPSKYRSLIHIDLVKREGSSESQSITEETKATSKTIDDCLSIIQNDNPDASVPKMFRQLLRCQRDNITRNLTKMETCKKAVETMWERDTALKNEEMILAEEARLKREEMEKEELRKKMKNDIRMSFKRSGKKKKKTKNVECIEKDCEGDVQVESTSEPCVEPTNHGKTKDSKKGAGSKNKVGEASTVEKKPKKGKNIADTKVIKISLGSSSNEDIDTQRGDQESVDDSKGECERRTKQESLRKNRRRSVLLADDSATKKVGALIVLDECTVGIEKLDMKKFNMKKKVKKKSDIRSSGIRCYMENTSSKDTATHSAEAKSGDEVSTVMEEIDNALVSPVTGSDKENMHNQDSLDDDFANSNGKSRKRKIRSSDSVSKRPKISGTTPRRMSMRNQTKNVLIDSNTEDSMKTDNPGEKKFTAVVGDVGKSNSADNQADATATVDTEEEDNSTSVKEENESFSNLRRSSRVRKPVLLFDPEELMDDMSFEDEKAAPPKQKQKRNEKKPDSVVVMDEKTSFSDEEDEVTIVEEFIDHQASKAALSKVIEKLDLLESPRKSPRKPILEIRLDECHINSSMTWLEKYQPDKARYVIGDKSRYRQMYDWLHLWKERQECAIRQSRSVKPSRSDTSDSESESEAEDFLSNTIVLSGPCGCGMTASVYACANQLDFKVMELNPSMYRTGKNIFDQVSEAVVSHQVSKTIEVSEPSADAAPAPKIEKKDFFSSRKSCSSTKKKDKADIKEIQKTSEKPKTNVQTMAPESSRALATSVDAMSLILFEQVDISYEELDRGFYQGIADLRMLSKRPIILTANDPTVFETMFMEEDTWIEHIALQYPSADMLLPMMQLTCLAEQVFIPQDVLSKIFGLCNNDIRKILLWLMFWCDQGKEPLYKKWSSKPSKTKKTPSAADKKETVDLTGDLETNIPDKSEDVCVTELSDSLLAGDVKGERLVDSKLLQDAGKCICSNTNGCHSFAREMKGYTYFDHIAASADNISQMNSILHRDTNIKRDTYYWTSSISDSLCETLSKDGHNASTRWANKLSTDIKQLHEDAYELYVENASSVPPSRRNISNSSIHTSVLQQGGEFTKYRIGRRSYHEDILPYMKKMCQIEEAKLATMHERKRGNRRYMHYLKSVGLHMEEDALTRLSQAFL